MGGTHLTETSVPADTGRGDAELIHVLSEAASCDDPAFLQAWRELVERHERRVFGLARHMAGPNDAEEIVQESFLSFYRAVRKKSLRKSSIAGWLATVATRKAIHINSKRRSERREMQRMQKDHERTGPAGGTAADDATQMEEARQKVADLVRELPEKLRVPIALYFSANLPQTEIAAELHCSQVTVSTRINEALDYLRNGLRKAGYSALPASWAVLLAMKLAAEDGPLLARCHEKLLKVPSHAAQSMRLVPKSPAPLSKALIATAGAAALVMILGLLAYTTVNTSAKAPAQSMPTQSQSVAEPIAPAAVPNSTDAATPPLRESALIYEDRFEKPELDKFWARVFPPSKPGYTIWQIDQSKLNMMSGGSQATRLLTHERLFPEVGLFSKTIVLDERPVEIDLENEMSFTGAYEIGIEFLDGDGHQLGLFTQARRVPNGPLEHMASGGPGTERTVTAPNTNAVNRFIVDRTGKLAQYTMDGGISYSKPGSSTGTLNGLVLHIFAKSIGAASGVSWTTKHARVIRLNDWPTADK